MSFLIVWTASQVDSLIKFYPEIEPYLLAYKVTLSETKNKMPLLKRICSLKDGEPCKLACERLAEERSPSVSSPPCPKTYTVLRYMYTKTKKREYLLEIGRLYPSSKEAKKLLEFKDVPRKLKLRIFWEHSMYDSILTSADTSDPEEIGFYLLAKWKKEGIGLLEIRKIPSKYRLKPLIDFIVRSLKSEDYDSIRLGLSELISLGYYKRAYRIMASEVAKPFYRSEATDLYIRLSSKAHEGLDAESFLWLGLSAYGVHYIEDAYVWFYEARKRAERGSFTWAQATYWLYYITRDTTYVRDLRLYAPVSYHYLSLGLPVPWRKEDVWDTSGSRRNYDIGRILERIWGWYLARRWYAKDVTAGYLKAKELIKEKDFLKAHLLLMEIYSVADKTKGVPVWWGKMTFPYGIYREEIDSASKEFDVDPYLLTAIVHAESSFNMRARSKAGAIGLAQIMPFNVKRFSREMGERVRNPYDPLTNLRMGAFYLREALDIYESPYLAAAAYNAGRAALNRWLCEYGYELLDFPYFIDIIPYYETRNYVRRVIRNYRIYKDLYGHFLYGER